MKKINALFLLSVISISLLILAETSTANAIQGSAKVYIICLTGVGGWSFPD
ncbi:MAG: hypothetical protein K6T73_11125 [Candidatus Bathyarchaeota archaeon]|nr:hypothetical protein [Candidatus Bathyarchaeota archaeon]